jgi:hypothetical protein
MINCRHYNYPLFFPIPPYHSTPWPPKRPTSTSQPLPSHPTCSDPFSSSFARRKAFAIKHQEAEPLIRRDLQYDLLYHIFAAEERVFTDPTLSSSKGEGPGASTAVTFRDLYVHALMSSPRCSKALREKMQETPDFATDFAKMSLLANVGRVNTTMTCPSALAFSSSARQILTGRRSPSGNAHGITYLPSRPFAAEGGRESPRRASHKEHPQGLQSQR